MARLAHKTTDETARLVEELSRIGTPQETISRIVGIAPKTLRKHYREILDDAETNANMRVANCLFSTASGQNENASVRDTITAAMFWLKTRAGWKETHELNHGGEININLLSGDEKL